MSATEFDPPVKYSTIPKPDSRARPSAVRSTLFEVMSPCTIPGGVNPIDGGASIEQHMNGGGCLQLARRKNGAKRLARDVLEHEIGVTDGQHTDSQNG